MIEVRCPKCQRFICAAPEGTPVRVFCVKCGLKWEETVKALTTRNR